MVRAIVFAAIIALVAIYSRETVAKTPVNPSIAEPAIAKHTKDIDDDNRSEVRLHHRGRRSPGGDVSYSGGGGSGRHNKSSLTGIASDRHGIPVSVGGGKKKQVRFSVEQISALERTFAHKHYPTRHEYKSLSAALGLTEFQIKTWFICRRGKLKEQIIYGGARIRMCIPNGIATDSGPSFNGIGRSEASSVTPSSVSGDIPHSIKIPLPEVPHSVSTSGHGVRTDGHRHYPSDVSAHSTSTHRAPAIFPFHHQHRCHQHPSHPQSHSLPIHQVSVQSDCHDQHQDRHHHHRSHIQSDSMLTHRVHLQPPQPPPSPPNRQPSPPSPQALDLRILRPRHKEEEDVHD